MERYNGVEPDPEGAFVYYDDAQRALDAEREKVKRLSTCGTDHSTPWWQVKCEDLEAQLTTLRQLVEALPVLDMRFDSVAVGPLGWTVGGVTFGKVTEANAYSALLQYRATLAAQDAPHPTEERS